MLAANANATLRWYVEQTETSATTNGTESLSIEVDLCFAPLYDGFGCQVNTQNETKRQ